MKEYKELLKNIKSQINTSRNNAILAVNKELIILYWKIGTVITKSQQEEGWGSKFVQRLSRDLREEFPDMKGFSERNLKYIRKLAGEYPDIEFVQEVLAQITWYHNITLLDKVKDYDERIWYINKTIENGWSRNVLVHQIETRLYERQKLSNKTTNYKTILTSPNSELAVEAFKDSMTEKRGANNPLDL